ncbi:PD-(D/E)XK nuclease family protein [Streptomyces sp. NBC_00490]|uniref:RecB family exonuclease n=1 Tax=Streptomyces sp. NBC_00490 TaxID=2903657 RepID=UPI002E16BBB6
MLQLPDHTSHSARETLERCARAYFLTRVAKAPQAPSLWLAGGSAVHETTEFYDLLRVGEAGDGTPEELMAFEVAGIWESCFNVQLGKAWEREDDESKWRSSKTEPIEVWRSMGLQFVQAYIEWRERSPWEIWIAPDGQPAIELDVSGKLPGCDVEIKAFLDRVFWDPVMKKLVIVDIKTSKKPPKTAAQFGTYAALLKVKYDVDVTMGAPFMNRKAALGTPFDLAEYTPEFVGEIFAAAWKQIQSGYFPANGFPGECFICDVKSSCAAQNGPLAPQYDPASPGYPPPF